MIEPARRVVAIVGRPNVGKSALFNRLLGRRLAIVHEESGVTRDRLIATARWDDGEVDLIDTGGLAVMDEARADHVIAAETRRQADVAVQDAAVVLLVVDLKDGVTPLDLEVARRLRDSGRAVLVIANKADTAELDERAPEFAELGFPVRPVSSLHNRGIDGLKAAVLERLPPPAPSAGAADPLKVAVVGRPNVGKSSFINRVLGYERVIVSEVPGTTRDSIDIPFSIAHPHSPRHYLLIDTAGMRRAVRVHSPVETFSLFRAEKTIERADIVLLVMDALDGPTQQDKKIAARILEHGRGCVMLVNKWDEARGKDVTQEDYEKALRREMFFLDYAPLLFVSAKSGLNVRKTLSAVDRVAAQVRTTLTTGLLNRVLRDAFARVQPPLVGGRRLKLYYAAQTGTAPIRLRLFVNDPARLTEAYRKYLVNELRRMFGLEGAPVMLELRSSHGE